MHIINLYLHCILALQKTISHTLFFTLFTFINFSFEKTNIIKKIAPDYNRKLNSLQIVTKFEKKYHAKA